MTTNTIAGTLAIRQCKNQLYPQFCNPFPIVTTNTVGGTLVVHQCKNQLHRPFCNSPSTVATNSIGHTWSYIDVTANPVTGADTSMYHPTALAGLYP